MGEISIKFTEEELQLLLDNFTQSFASEHDGNEDLDAIRQKLVTARVRLAARMDRK